MSLNSGAVLGIMGSQALALANMKVAAQLGAEEARALLTRRGIDWQDCSFQQENEEVTSNE